MQETQTFNCQGRLCFDLSRTASRASTCSFDLRIHIDICICI